MAKIHLQSSTIHTVSQPQKESRHCSRLYREPSWPRQEFTSILMWNAARVKPPGCDVMQGIVQQGLKMLVTPLFHPDFLPHESGVGKTSVTSGQASLLRFVHGASARANNMTRVVEPVSSLEFCERNDLAHCLCNTMQSSPSQAQDIRQTATLAMILGGLGLEVVVA